MLGRNAFCNDHSGYEPVKSLTGFSASFSEHSTQLAVLTLNFYSPLLKSSFGVDGLYSPDKGHLCPPAATEFLHIFLLLIRKINQTKLRSSLVINRSLQSELLTLL